MILSNHNHINRLFVNLDALQQLNTNQALSK